MKILPIQNLKYTSPSYSANVDYRKNLSFGSTGTYIAGKAAILSTIKALKSREVSKFKSNYIKLLENPENIDKLELASQIIRLGKTKNSIDHSLNPITFIIDLFSDCNEKLDSLKKRTANELFPKLDDTNTLIRLSKQNLFDNMFEFGEYVDEDFSTYIKALPNSQYSEYKKSLADKALYTLPQYRIKNTPEQYLYSYKLIEALDDGTGIYDDYMKKNQAQIIETYNKFHALANKTLTETHNAAFGFYSFDFVSDGFLETIPIEKKSWHDLLKDIFYDYVAKFHDNPKELSKALNIDEVLTEEILKDIDSLGNISDAKTDNEKLELLHKRIKEKLATKTAVEDDTSFGSNNYRNLLVQCYGIKSYLKAAERLNVKISDDEFNQKYKKQIEEINAKMQREREYNSFFNNMMIDSVYYCLENNYYKF